MTATCGFVLTETWVGRASRGFDRFYMTNELMKMNVNDSDGRVIGHKNKKKEKKRKTIQTITSTHPRVSAVDEILSDLI